MSDTLHILIIICPLVFLAGLIDSVVGGGELISLPAYMAVGIPPHFATATNKCSSTFGTLLSTIRFLKDGRINFKAALSAAFSALLGSFIGAKLNMCLDEKYLRYLLIFVLPIIAIFLIFKKDFGACDRTNEISNKKIVTLSLISGLIIGVYDGFFGPGTGTFLILIFTGVVGFDLVTASGNAKVVNLASNMSAFITFAISGKIIWTIGIPAALFGIAGNWVGSGLAIKNGSKIIRPMFFITLGLLMIKILIDSIF